MIGVVSASAQKVPRKSTGEYCLGGSYRLCLSEADFAVEDCAGLGIALDGELFHTAELARSLGVETGDDTRLLLLDAYRKWGANFPNFLDGEFSFVLWDKTVRRVVLGCSPGNSYPLSYALRDGGLYFASELGVLLQSLPRIPALDRDYIANWLALIVGGSTSTFFEGVSRLLPGSVVVYEEGRVKFETYWRADTVAPLRLRDSREYAEGLRLVLQKAIADRVTGRSTGTHLSGGLDSSTVTALTAEIFRNEDRRLYAFTAVPEHPTEDISGRFCDEGPRAASVAAVWPNVDHVLVSQGRHSVFFLMDMFGTAQMEPTLNPANYDWVYEICLQAQRRHLDVLLCGDSGNFSVSYDGGLALHELALRGEWQRLYRLARRMHSKGGRRWRGLVYDTLGPWVPLPVRGFVNAAQGRATAVHRFSLMRRDFARRYGVNDLAYMQESSQLDSRGLRRMYLQRPQSANANNAIRRLTGLLRLDPTGDRRVVEYCLSVPVECYCADGVPRSLIRDAMAGRLPEVVRTERRRGLQAADYAKHFHKDRNEALAELERLKHSDLASCVLNLDAMEQMLHFSDTQISAQQGILLYWPKLLRALALGRFIRRYEDGSLFTAPVQDPACVAIP